MQSRAYSRILKNAMIRALIILIVVLLCGSHSLADSKKHKDKITKEEAKKIAIDLFSEKCGIPRKTLEKSRYIIEFDGWYENCWDISVERFAGDYWDHPPAGFHYIVLRPDGELVSWNAHGYTFSEYNPDYINMGIEVEPHETDAKEEDILKLLKKDLEDQYKISNAEAYRYMAKYMLHECFHANYGPAKTIPMWIVYIYDKNEKLCWKAAYTYCGELISLVTAEQDFTCYNLQNEDFVYALYKGHDPTTIRRHTLTVYNAIKQPEQLERWGITETLREEYLKEWIPAYHEWLKTHPYSIDWVMEGIIEHYPQYAQNSE